MNNPIHGFVICHYCKTQIPEVTLIFHYQKEHPSELKQIKGYLRVIDEKERLAREVL